MKNLKIIKLSINYKNNLYIIKLLKILINSIMNFKKCHE